MWSRLILRGSEGGAWRGNSEHGVPWLAAGVAGCTPCQCVPQNVTGDVFPHAGSQPRDSEGRKRQPPFGTLYSVLVWVSQTKPSVPPASVPWSSRDSLPA